MEAARSEVAPGRLEASNPTWIPVLCVSGFLIQCAVMWPFTMDDAFISFRYAKHIGDGLGPIWNPADAVAPVEGYTSFLHVWFLGALRWLTGVDLVLAGKVLGVAATLTLAVWMVRRARALDFGTLPVLVALSFLLLPVTAIHSVSGMETMLFALLNWAVAIACIDLVREPTARGAALFTAMGLAATLTRPEFGAPFLALAAYVGWTRPTIRKSLLSAVLVLFVLPGLLLTAWRLQYYGDVVPNPFHVKQGGGITRAGVIYVSRFLAVIGLPYLLWSAFGFSAVWKRHRDVVAVVGIACGVPFLYFTTTLPLMGWWQRLLLPQVPLLAWLAATALQSRRSLGWPIGRLRAVTPGVLLVLLTAAHLPAIAWWLPGHHQHELRYRAVGERLAPFAAPERWLTYWDVGAVVYESDWNTLDVVGLNTRWSRIGHHCEMRTDLVLAHTISGGEMTNPCDGLYELVAELPFLTRNDQVDARMAIFARNDIEYREDLREALLADWPAPWVNRAPRLGAYWSRTRRLFFE